MIIDVHSHLGLDCVFDEDFTEMELLEKHDKFGISKSIIQPATCHDMETVKKQHNTIFNLIKEYPDQFRGMANPNPHLNDTEYESEIRRCIEEMGFVGIKLHTSAHAVNPMGKDGKKVFGLAEKLNVPVMVHTGAGIPFANPSNIIPISNQYPDVKIIIAHCGMMVMASEVSIIMEQCPNIYAEVSWTGGFLIKSWVKTFGAERFMFGSDHADNASTEIAKIKTCGISLENQEQILYKTAEKVFDLEK